MQVKEQTIFRKLSVEDFGLKDTAITMSKPMENYNPSLYKSIGWTMVVCMVLNCKATNGMTPVSHSHGSKPKSITPFVEGIMVQIFVLGWSNASINNHR